MTPKMPNYATQQNIISEMELGYSGV